MQVNLELRSSDGQGRSVRMVSNQSLAVGRSPWADFTVEQDPRLADHHFELETDKQMCLVKALSTDHQVLVNGKQVASATLRSGDRIEAGGSIFVVHIEGDLPPSSEPSVHDSAGQAPSRPAGPVAGPDARCHKLPCASGLVAYQAMAESISPSRVVMALAAEGPVHLVIDPRRAKNAFATLAGETGFVCDWLGDAARENSPVLVTRRGDEASELITGAWACDGLIVLLSPIPSGQLLDHLRLSMRPQPDRVVGWCWPGIARQLLAHGSRESVQSFLQPLDHVLMEAGEGGKEWIMFSRDSLDEDLQAHGIHPETASTEGAKASA